MNYVYMHYRYVMQLKYLNSCEKPLSCSYFLHVVSYLQSKHCTYISILYIHRYIYLAKTQTKSYIKVWPSHLIIPDWESAPISDRFVRIANTWTTPTTGQPLRLITFHWWTTVLANTCKTAGGCIIVQSHSSWTDTSSRRKITRRITHTFRRRKWIGWWTLRIKQ